MVMKRLEKLLGKSDSVQVEEIELTRIEPSPYQARRQFEERELSDLAQSIENYGVIQPIVIRPVGEKFQIVAGERRYRACALLGLRTIPAIVQKMEDERAAAVSLIENLQRRELNYFEEALAYQMLIEGFGRPR